MSSKTPALISAGSSVMAARVESEKAAALRAAEAAARPVETPEAAAAREAMLTAIAKSVLGGFKS